MFQKGYHILHSYPFIHDGPQNKRIKTKHSSDNKIKVPEGALHIKPAWKPVTLDEKPPFSYATIIAHAILSSPERKLTLSEIYQWISEQYPCYSIKDHRWQNSIRHNLSLQKAFAKLDRDSNTPTSGKGSYWTILPGYEQQFIDNLIKHDKSITRGHTRKPNQKTKSSHLFTIFKMTPKTTPQSLPSSPPKEEMTSIQQQQEDDSDCDSGIDLDCTTTKIPPYEFPQQQQQQQQQQHHQNNLQDLLLFDTYMEQSLYLLTQPTLDLMDPAYAETPLFFPFIPSSFDPDASLDPSLYPSLQLNDTSAAPTLDYYSFY